MAAALGRKSTQFLGLCFTPGCTEVTPEQTYIGVFFSIFIQQLSLGKKRGGDKRLLPTSSPTPTFCKMPILRPQCTCQSAHATTVAMAATIPNFLFVIKYSYRIALNFKIRLDTAPKRSPSQLLDISYYRNQSLGTGAHSRRSCRFQFYIVINAAGEENFTTIAGVGCTNADLFHPVTPRRCRWTCSPPLPRTQLPPPLVLKWFPQSLCWGATANVAAFFNGFISSENVLVCTCKMGRWKQQ